MKTVAALYTLGKTSPYAAMPEVDCWGERRNALLYRGNLPVVAHPPCGPWSRAVAHQTHLTHSQGKYHAPFALKVVRRNGGVLEHPAGSRLWDVMSLPYPLMGRQLGLHGPERDRWGGWTLEVYQRDWGHCAPKRTWLYLVGIDPESVHLPPPAESAPAEKTDRVRVDKRNGRTWRRSAYDMRSPESRKRTPPAFARFLVDLAANAKRPEAT